MILRDLSIDAFGGWRGCGLSDLSPGLNVFYGPNEAGKTTVLQFVRSVFYGFSPERRRRFLPPLGGGPAGGSLTVEVGGKRRRLERSEDPREPLGRLVIVDESGETPPPQLLDQWLGHLGDDLYTHVFALELDELQEISGLSGPDTIRTFYELSVGLGDVRIGKVQADLKHERREWLAGPGEPSRIRDLLARRDALAEQLVRDRGALDEEQALLASRRELQGAIEADEGTVAELERRLARLAGLAEVREVVARRAELEKQLAACTGVPKGAAKAIEKLAALDKRLQTARTRRDQADREARRCRAEADKLPVQRPIWQQRGKVEAALQQLAWVPTLEGRSAEWKKEVARCEGELATLRKELAVDSSAVPGTVAEAAWDAVRPLAADAVRTRRAYRRRKLKARRRKEAVRAAEIRLDPDVPESSSHRDLQLAWEEAARSADLLHERKHLEQRIGQLHEDYQEAAARSGELVDSQVMPTWVLYVLAGVFTLGVMVLAGSFVLPAWFSGHTGWLFSLLGLAGLGISGGVNYAWQRAAEFRLEKVQQQAESLSAAIVQLQEEQRRIDVDLPPSNASLDDRIAQIEAEKARLEELLPLAGRRRGLKSKAVAAVRQAKSARAAMQASMKTFREAVKTHGLPAKTLPSQLQSLSQRMQQTNQLQTRVRFFKQELERHQALIEQIRDQARGLVKELGQSPNGDLETTLKKLAGVARDQGERLAKRRTLRKEYLSHRRTVRRADAIAKRLDKAKAARLKKYGVASPAELTRSAQQLVLAKRLREELEPLKAALRTKAQPLGKLPRVLAELETHAGEKLPRLRKETEQELQAVRKRLAQRLEERGRLEARWSNGDADPLQDERRLQLAALEAELQAACETWQGLAVAGELLDAVRIDFERHRQPRTLTQAAEYLRILSDGRYVQVSATLESRSLRIEDRDGRVVPVEKLSRGTREQLYLALRLSLIADYRRRGVQLPVVLDDLFVNFDEDRTRAAVRLLTEFARDGHQVIVLTCHLRTAERFQEFGVAVRALPGRATDGRLRRLPPAIDRDRTPGFGETRLEPRPEPRFAPHAEPELSADDFPNKPRGFRDLVDRFGRDADAPDLGLDDSDPDPLSVIEVPEPEGYGGPPDPSPPDDPRLLPVRPEPVAPLHRRAAVAASAAAFSTALPVDFAPEKSSSSAAAPETSSSSAAVPETSSAATSVSAVAASYDSIWWHDESRVAEADSQAAAIGSGFVWVADSGSGLEVAPSVPDFPPVAAQPDFPPVAAQPEFPPVPAKPIEPPPPAEVDLESRQAWWRLAAWPLELFPTESEPETSAAAAAYAVRAEIEPEPESETASPAPYALRAEPGPAAVPEESESELEPYFLEELALEPLPPEPAPAPAPTPVAVRRIAEPGWSIEAVHPRLYLPDTEEIIVEPDEPGRSGTPAMRFIEIPLAEANALLGNRISSNEAEPPPPPAEPPAPVKPRTLRREPAGPAAPERRRDKGTKRPAAGAPKPRSRSAAEPTVRRREPPLAPLPIEEPPAAHWHSARLDTVDLTWHDLPPLEPTAEAPPVRPQPPQPQAVRPQPAPRRTNLEDFVPWAEWGELPPD